jgi:DNA-binding transcriptional regulator YiaG
MAEKRKQARWDAQSIRSLRRHLELTQGEMADKMGTRQQTISEWETGQYRPRGTAATLLTMMAREAKFSYRAEPDENQGY